MKQRRNRFLDIRVQFFFICMAGFVVVALLAALAGWGLEHLGVDADVRLGAYFSRCCSAAPGSGFSIAFFAPISRLSHSMKEVAGGNFHVHVETKSIFRDIRDIYDNFNLMVSELNATETLQTDFHLQRFARIQNAHQRHRGLCLALAGASAVERVAGGVYRQDPLQYAPPLHPLRAIFCC